MNDYTDSWWQQYLNCTPGYTCSDCKHANYYPAPFWYPYLDPLCVVKKTTLKPDQPACQQFQLIGRLSR